MGPAAKIIKTTNFHFLCTVMRAPDSSNDMRTLLVVSRGTNYYYILKSRIKLYNRFALKLHYIYRTEKMFKIDVCCCYYFL